MSSLNQAIKSVAVARGFLALNGKDIVVRPVFDTIEIENEQRTIIKLLVSLA